MKYKVIALASVLPYAILNPLARRFDTPGAFIDSTLGHSVFADASYYKWCRVDKRRSKRANPDVYYGGAP